MSNEKQFARVNYPMDDPMIGLNDKTNVKPNTQWKISNFNANLVLMEYKKKVRQSVFITYNATVPSCDTLLFLFVIVVMGFLKHIYDAMWHLKLASYE